MTWVAVIVPLMALVTVSVTVLVIALVMLVVTGGGPFRVTVSGMFCRIWTCSGCRSTGSSCYAGAA